MGKYKIVQGIYLIHCATSNKFYVGSSKSVFKRWENHKYKLRRGIHDNTHLQHAWNLYSEDAFSFSVIERTNCTSQKEMEKIEKKWVLFYKSHLSEFGYNSVLPGNIHLKKDEENKTRVKENLNAIVAINKSSGEIRDFSNCAMAAKELGIKVNKVRDIVHYWEGKQSKSKSKYGWTFIKKNRYTPEYNYFQRKERLLKDGHKKTWKDYSKKKKPEDIIPYSDRNIKRCAIIAINGETQNKLEFSSVRAAIQFGFKPKGVYKCLKNEYGKYKHGGYFFKYKQTEGEVR